MHLLPRGWWQVLRRAFAESSADNVSILAGGVAYFSFLALFPALVAALTLYGLVADPATITRQVGALAGALPREAQPIVTGALEPLTASGGSTLGIGLVVSVLAALWSASGGTTATRPRASSTNTMAPSVRASAVPRSRRNPRVSSSS